MSDSISVQYSMVIKTSEWLTPDAPVSDGQRMLDETTGRKCCLQHYVEQVCHLSPKVTRACNLLAELGSVSGCYYPNSILNTIKMEEHLLHDGSLAPAWDKVVKPLGNSNEYGNTELACSASRINDDTELSFEDRQASLVKLFAEHGVRLAFDEDWQPVSDREFEIDSSFA